MVDNAEWTVGVTETRFGIQHVNFTTLERHFKRSALALCKYRTILRNAHYAHVLLAEFYATHKS